MKQCLSFALKSPNHLVKNCENCKPLEIGDKITIFVINWSVKYQNDVLISSNKRWNICKMLWIFFFPKNIGKNISKNISKKLNVKYSQRHLENAKQSTTFKTTSKKAIQKTAEATGDLIDNKIADTN